MMKVKLVPGGNLVEANNPQSLAKHLKLPLSRLKLTTVDGKPIEKFVDGMTIKWKDLGPQISWQTVFILEYAGPIIIHLFLAMRAAKLTWFQLLAGALICGHFVKREWETLFVHRFSHDTMPLMNLFKNCTHYWLLAGWAIAWQLYRPTFQTPSLALGLLGISLFLLGEWGNWHCHRILSELRPPGSTKRAIPKGFVFEWFSCANYTMEIMAWIGYSLMTGVTFAWVFTVVATIQMGLWARKKHQRYLKVKLVL